MNRIDRDLAGEHGPAPDSPARRAAETRRRRAEADQLRRQLADVEEREQRWWVRLSRALSRLRQLRAERRRKARQLRDLEAGGPGGAR